MTEQNHPEKVTGLEGIGFCRCMQSDNWPFCDGSHHTFGTGKEPGYITLEKEKSYLICRCYKTKNPPFCDGSHEK